VYVRAPCHLPAPASCGVVVTALAWAALGIFLVAYVLIATEWVHRLVAVLAGASIMLLAGITDPAHAFFSHETGIDWTVIFLLLGMMLIVAVLGRTGLFDFLGIWAVQRARGRPFRLMVLLVIVTAVASAALDNVTTVLLLVPVTLSICRRLGVPAPAFVIAEVLASNIGGAATLVGDPPNIIIASRAGLGFNDFLIHLGPFVAVMLLVLVGLCRWLFRSALTYQPDRAAEVMRLSARDAIGDRRLLTVSLGVLGLVLVGFVAGHPLGVEPSVVALVGGLLLVALSRLDPAEVATEVEWPTLVFFAGLFVMVGGLARTGVIDTLAHLAAGATDGRLAATSIVLVIASAALSAIVDNIPYVATASPIVADLANQAGGTSGQGQVLWWALALGADLGGNATAIGASANVVALGLAARAGQRISFWQFTRYGLIVTAVTITAAVGYVWLRYFALA
jgi:anion transporter